MPVNRALMYAASGDSVWSHAVARLAQRPDVVWLFATESYAAQQAYLRALYGFELQLVSTPADQQFADRLCALIDKKKGTVVAMVAPGAGAAPIRTVSPAAATVGQ